LLLQAEGIFIVLGFNFIISLALVISKTEVEYSIPISSQ
jgi:hypothetical protein